MKISEEEKDLLRKVALAAAARAIGMRGAPPPAMPEGGSLSQPAPVFVTWLKDGRPRGRSGSLAADAPLHTLVEKHAVEALLHDPRVPPATGREFPRYVPEISVLSSFKEIPSSSESSSKEIFSSSSLSEAIPSSYGVFVEKGKRRGIVLPQDALGLDWDAARILSQACLRAGLPEDSWKAASPPRILRFTAEVF